MASSSGSGDSRRAIANPPLGRLLMMGRPAELPLPRFHACGKVPRARASLGHCIGPRHEACAPSSAECGLRGLATAAGRRHHRRMSENVRKNELGQPIGAPLPGWVGRPRPPRRGDAGPLVQHRAARPRRARGRPLRRQRARPRWEKLDLSALRAVRRPPGLSGLAGPAGEERRPALPHRDRAGEGPGPGASPAISGSSRRWASSRSGTST